MGLFSLIIKLGEVMKQLIFVLMILAANSYANLISNDEKKSLLKDVFTNTINCKVINISYESHISKKCVDTTVVFLTQVNREYIVDKQKRVQRDLDAISKCPQRTSSYVPYYLKSCVDTKNDDISYELNILFENGHYILNTSEDNFRSRLKVLKNLTNIVKKCKVAQSSYVDYYNKDCIASTVDSVIKLYKVSLEDFRDVVRDLESTLTCQARSISYETYILKNCVDNIITNVLKDLNQLGETPLLKAISLGQVAKVKELLIAGNSKIDRGDLFGRTPLVLSLLEKKVEIAKLLLRYGANPSLSEETEAPVFVALNSELDELVKLILEKGVSKDVLDKNGESLLTLSLKKENEKLSYFLFKNGYDYLTSFNDKTALELAIEKGYEMSIEMADTLSLEQLRKYITLSIKKNNIAFFDYILSRGYEPVLSDLINGVSIFSFENAKKLVTKQTVNALSHQGYYGRAYVIARHSVELLDYCIKEELFNINDDYNREKMPIPFAIFEHRTAEYRSYLLNQKDFDVKALYDGKSLLYNVVAGEYSLRYDRFDSLIKKLINLGASLTRKINGKSAAYLLFNDSFKTYKNFVKEGYIDVNAGLVEKTLRPVELASTGNGKMQALIKLGASLDVFTDQGKTWLLEKIYNTHIRDMFISDGNLEGINKLFSNSRTALTDAVKRSDYELVKKLLSREEVDINQLDGFSEAALHIAATDADEEMIEILLSKGASRELVDGSGKTAYQIVKEARDKVFFLGLFKKHRLKKLMNILK